MTADDIDVLSLTAPPDAERASLLVGKPPRVRRSVLHASTRWLMHHIAVAFAVSRILAVAALLAGGSSTQGRPSTGGLTAWDGQWYLIIIRSGYGRPPVAHHWSTWPFFPLLPGMARACTILGVPPRWGLVAIANVAFVIGLAGVWRLALSVGSRRVALIAVWAIAVAPFASVFSMGYLSSLFLAASTWAFGFLNDRRYLAAGVAGAFATLARPNGAVVLVALAIAVGWSARSYGEQALSNLSRRAAVACGPGLVALGIWCLELWRWTGNPVVFWSAKAGWNELTIVTFIHTWALDGLPHFLVAVAALTLVVATARRLPPAWVAFAALISCLRLDSGSSASAGTAANASRPSSRAASCSSRLLGYLSGLCWRYPRRRWPVSLLPSLPTGWFHEPPPLVSPKDGLDDRRNWPARCARQSPLTFSGRA